MVVAVACCVGDDDDDDVTTMIIMMILGVTVGLANSVTAWQRTHPSPQSQMPSTLVIVGNYYH